METITKEVLQLLENLIRTPSFSGEEEQTAEILVAFFEEKKIPVSRFKNNVWVKNKYFDPTKENLLLNSHHDTVRPAPAYTRDPFDALQENGKLFGLGSNDAGASLVSLLACFLFFYELPELKYNLIFAASAEEENSGPNGMCALLPDLGKINAAIVGEPTGMNLAVAERGLVVLDCEASGKSGHAAREEGINAIYLALQDIEKIRNHSFEKVSEFLGPVKMTVTSIETPNRAHNVVPDSCRFVVDVRVNELYSLEEIVEEIKKLIQSEVRPRSLRLRATSISAEHPLVKAGLNLGKKMYGSPTSSDKALMPFPVLKMGPGESSRSHTADEYVYVKEIEEGIATYIDLLKEIV